MSVEQTQEPEPPLSSPVSVQLGWLLVNVSVVRRLIEDHLRWHEKRDTGANQKIVQGLMLIGIAVDVILHFH